MGTAVSLGTAWGGLLILLCDSVCSSRLRRGDLESNVLRGRYDRAHRYARSVMEGRVIEEAARRRTLAVIPHPDAGKSTPNQEVLLSGGALPAGAGSVKAREGRRSATSDWME